ncbi:MAG: universal stress protein [Allomuricauda sp.]
MKKNILIPYDFSKESKYALKLASQIALTTNSKLKIVHALGLSNLTILADDERMVLLRDLQVKAREALRKEMDAHNMEYDGFEIEISEDSPSTAILKSTYEFDADFVLLGFKNQQIPDKVGSTTRDILRYAKGSVVSLKYGMDIHDLKRIIVITDFENTPIAAIENVKFLKDLSGAQLRFLLINTHKDWHTTTETEKRLKTFSDIHNLDNVAVDIINDDSVEVGILNYLKKNPADLLVMNIKKFGSKVDPRETHLTAEIILDNANTNVMSFAFAGRFGP